MILNTQMHNRPIPIPTHPHSLPPPPHPPKIKQLNNERWNPTFKELFVILKNGIIMLAFYFYFFLRFRNKENDIKKIKLYLITMKILQITFI